MKARIHAVQARLKDIRGRRGALRRALGFRHARTLYWQAQARTRPTADGRARAREKAHASAELGREIRHTLKVVTEREHNALQKLKHLEKLAAQTDTDGDGLIWVDGRQVAEQVGREVLRIRASGRWKGVIVSGYRTPAYSESLCYRMCGRPSCPGRCAGRATNHARKGGRNGAIDVSDYWTFNAECRRLGSWLENHLSQDPVHFSDSGG